MPEPKEKPVNLTDPFLHALKPTGGARRNISDIVEPGLVVQVGARGRLAFYVVGRINGAQAWRKLGTYPAFGLAEAREAARAGRAAMAAGKDPKKLAEARRHAQAEAEREHEANNWAAVAERFNRWYSTTPGRGGLPRRTAGAVARTIARELTPEWGPRPISEITERDVARLMNAIRDRAQFHGSGKAKSGGPNAARHAFAATRLLFGWARRQRFIATDPTADISPADLHGPPTQRTRVLEDWELAAVWRAAEATSYPYGPFLQLLMLSGARLREVAQASWDEIDLAAATLTMPVTRAKMKSPHVIPLPPKALELVETLPRFAGGRFLFSTTTGRRPISGFSKLRARFDKTLAAILEGRPMARWTPHDLRRSCRTACRG